MSSVRIAKSLQERRLAQQDFEQAGTEIPIPKYWWQARSSSGVIWLRHLIDWEETLLSASDVWPRRRMYLRIPTA